MVFEQFVAKVCKQDARNKFAAGNNNLEFLPEFYLESLEPAQILCELADDMTQAKIVMRIFDDSWEQKYTRGLPPD